MSVIKNKLLKNKWIDSKNNILTFAKISGELTLLIDGNECTEGIEEKIDSLPDDIFDVLDWYNYNELKQIFQNWINKNNT